MKIREVDPSTYDVDYFRDTKHILEIGVGSSGVSAVTPALDPDVYVVTDVLPSQATYAADFTDYSMFYWGRRCPDPRVVKVHADGAHLPFRDESFDAVFAANVIGDLSISAYDKADIIAESLRVTKRWEKPLGASALWLIENNTPEYTENFMESWGASDMSEGLSVEKATIHTVDRQVPIQFQSRNYPLQAGYDQDCTIYKIAPASDDTQAA